MKRITIFMLVALGGMGIAFTVGKRANAVNAGKESVVVDTASMANVINDSGEALRINGKLINPGQTWSGAGHEITIYVPSKSGIFHIKGNLASTNLKFSEIKHAVGPEKVDAFDIVSANGNIGSIMISYEALPYAAD